MNGSQISITDGVNAVVDAWLDVGHIGGAPHYRHVETALLLSRGPRTPRDPYDLIVGMLAAIERVWAATRATSRTWPSKENWRFEQQLGYTRRKPGREVVLERTIAALSKDWANQVPTASGLSGATHDRVRDLDLVHRDAPDAYTWYELKVNSGTPVYAALEILLYGLLYLFTRRRVPELGYDPSRKEMELLRAREVHLRVLAPATYYARYDLRWLELALNDGLFRYLRDAVDLDIAMDFAFLAFPPTFVWPCETAILSQAVAYIRRVYPQE